MRLGENRDVAQLDGISHQQPERGHEQCSDPGIVDAGATGDARHEFWPDDVGYADVPIQGIIGHRQVTDAYLARLARARGSRLATFDQAMAKLHNDVSDLVPDS